MKICPKCGTENKDSCAVCRECYSSLYDIKPENPQAVSDSFFEREEKAEKRKKKLSTLPILFYYCIYLTFYILCIIKDRACFFPLLLPLGLPLLYYLLRFKADSLFRLQHICEIDNLDEVQPSDWYYFNSHVSAYIILIFGLILVIRTYLELF